MFLKNSLELYQTASRATKFSLSFWNVMDVVEKFCIQRFSSRKVMILTHFWNPGYQNGFKASLYKRMLFFYFSTSGLGRRNNLNPLTPKISFKTLFIVCHTILTMFV